MARLQLVLLVAVSVAVAQLPSQRVPARDSAPVLDEQTLIAGSQQRLHEDSPDEHIFTAAQLVTGRGWDPYQEYTTEARGVIIPCDPDRKSSASSKANKKIRREKTSKKIRLREVREESFCLQDGEYDLCPSNIDYDHCSCDDASHTVTVEVSSLTQPPECYLTSCLALFTMESKFRYCKLLVILDELPLEKDILGGMIFDEVHIEGDPIPQIHEEFLGMSRNTTKKLTFKDAAGDKVPYFEANSLESFTLWLSTTDTVKLRRSSLQHLQQLRSFVIETWGDLELKRNVFRDLPNIEEVHLNYGGFFTKLEFGSLLFHPGTTVSEIGVRQLAEAAAGSIAPLPGTTITINNNRAGWSPTIWFNFLAAGGRLKMTAFTACSCSMAWIHRSAFLQHTRIYCSGSGWFHELDSHHFDDCSPALA